jgi:hypothetical protein
MKRNYGEKCIQLNNNKVFKPNCMVLMPPNMTKLFYLPKLFQMLF